MKLMLGGTPVKKMMIHNDTMDATMVASDMQAGVTAYANGQKVTGTGKSFEFAYYGSMTSNDSLIIPVNDINVVQISSLEYPVCSTIRLGDMKSLDFGTSQVIGNLIIDNSQYTISVYVQYNEIFIICDATVDLQIFFGKDNYV